MSKDEAFELLGFVKILRAVSVLMSVAFMIAGAIVLLGWGWGMLLASGLCIFFSVVLEKAKPLLEKRILEDEE